ncbi:Cytoplasmic dynein 2 heavy chain 1 [Bienertia sinuspersici]
MSDSSEFTTPTSEKTPSCVVVHDNGISDSSEFTQSPNKRSLGNTSKEVVSAYHEPATPSPVNRNKGVSAPQTPSISSSKEVESSPIHGNPNHGKTVHGNDLVMMLMILKRLESELEETKKELKLLKERESETEVALASLNAELHKNMSKIARAEATEAAKAAAKSGTLLHDGNQEMDSKSKDHQERNGYHDEVMIKHVDSPTLAQILSITDYDCYFENSNKLKKKMKKKPIIPLLTDLLPWWKRSQSPSRYQSAPLFSSH